MRVTKCDACGTTYKHYNGDETQKESNGLILINWKGNGTYEKRHNPAYVDLCPDCMRKIAAFLSGEEIAEEIKHED